MKIRKFFPVLFLAVILALFFTACKNEMVVDPENSEPTTDKGAMEKLADEDSSLTSFDYNYNEEGLMDLGKINSEIYPIKVGQKMRLVNRTLSIDVQDTIAYGTLTKTFEGTLFIAATYDPNSSDPDTVIEKSFTSVITRKIIFRKINNTPRPFRNWIIAAISLPEGGALSPNIDIQKATIYLQNGDTLVITSPNEYFLRRGWGWWRGIPYLHRGDSVKVRIELYSQYEDEDYVTLTYGANKWIKHRAKRRFELISSTPNGNGFDKVYEQTFQTHQFPGFFHAVVNAMPKQVIHDDATPVESESWGIPYIVHSH